MKSRLSFRWPVLVCVAVCAPLVFLFLHCLQSAFWDIRMIYTAALKSETDKLRMEAVRRAGNLETLLEGSPTPIAWEAWYEVPRHKSYWQTVADPSGPQIYTAVVDRSGKVVMHSD